MKALLTGMPDCKFGMNDKIVMEKESLNKKARRTHGISCSSSSYSWNNFDVS